MKITTDFDIPCKPEKTIKVPWLAGGVVFGAAFIVGIAPHFWWVVAVPSLLFLCLQFVAVNSWFPESTQKQVFIYTEYIYYILIVVVLGLGVRFLQLREDVAAYNASLNVQRDVERLKGINDAISTLKKELADAQGIASDVNVLRLCQNEALAIQLPTAKGNIHAQGSVVKPDACRAFLDSGDKVAALPKEIETLEGQSGELSQKLQVRPPGTLASGQSRKQSPKPNPQIDYMYSPMFLFLGVVLKLGKTTYTLVST